MKTRVVNKYKEDYQIYIGRGSKWGNPFKIGIDGNRITVITKYKKYLLSNEELMAALPELKGMILGCYCKPKACHGDVLAELANKL